MSACRLLCLLNLIVASPGLAAAADPEVSIEPDDAGVTFRITGPKDARRAAVQLKVEDGGEVLVVRVKGLRTGRRWLEIDDPRVQRVLQHPSRRGVWTNVRARFTAPVAQAAADGADVRVESRTYVVRVPLGLGEEPTVVPPVPVPVPVPVPEDPEPTPVAPPPTPVPEDPTPEDPQPTPVPEDPVPEDPIPEDPLPDPPTPTTPIVTPTAPPGPGIVPDMDALAGRLHGALAPPSPPTLAVLPLRGDAASADQRLDALATGLLTQRFAWADRAAPIDPERVRAAVAEAPRAEDGGLTPEQALAVGRLLGADTVVTGRLTLGEGATTLHAEVLDVATGVDRVHGGQMFDTAAFLALRDEALREQTAFDGVWRSALAPGWGQIHNGDTARGAVYLALFGASLAGGIGAGVVGRGAQDDYDDGQIDRRDDANDAYLVANVLFATAGAVWLTAVVDAAITGESSQTFDLAPYGGAP
jgi:hypothetical protein